MLAVAAPDLGSAAQPPVARWLPVQGQVLVVVVSGAKEQVLKPACLLVQVCQWLQLEEETECDDALSRSAVLLAVAALLPCVSPLEARTCRFASPWRRNERYRHGPEVGGRLGELGHR